MLLASNLGLNIHTLPPGSSLSGATCLDIEALTIATSTHGGMRFDVFLDPLSVAARQRFSLMHEISHVWLGHLDSEVPSDREQWEGEANFLSQYILAPDALVEAWVPDLMAEQIRQVFCVGWHTANLVRNRVIRSREVSPSLRDYDQRIAKVARRAPQSEFSVAGGVA